MVRALMPGPHAEQIKLFNLNAVAGRNRDQFTLLLIEEHDHDLFGLQDHRDALYEAAEGGFTVL